VNEESVRREPRIMLEASSREGEERMTVRRRKWQGEKDTAKREGEG